MVAQECTWYLSMSLERYPFNKNGGVSSLFKDKVNVVKDIVCIIDKVN